MNKRRITSLNPFGFERGDKVILSTYGPLARDKSGSLDDYTDAVGKSGELGVVVEDMAEFYWEDNGRRRRHVVLLIDLIPIGVKNKDFKSLLKKR